MHALFGKHVMEYCSRSTPSFPRPGNLFVLLLGLVHAPNKQAHTARKRQARPNKRFVKKQNPGGVEAWSLCQVSRIKNRAKAYDK